MKCDDRIIKENNKQSYNYNSLLDVELEKNTTKEKHNQNYKNEIEKKLICATKAYLLLLITLLTNHAYLAYNNYRDCENKIEIFNNNFKSSNHYEINSNSKEVIYICSSYLMHVCLIVGFFLIAFITIIRQTTILFNVFEVYIIIIVISDFFFSFLNPINMVHVCENMINFVIVRYIKFLNEEMNRIG